LLAFEQEIDIVTALGVFCSQNWHTGANRKKKKYSSVIKSRAKIQRATTSFRAWGHVLDVNFQQVMKCSMLNWTVTIMELKACNGTLEKTAVTLVQEYIESLGIRDKYSPSICPAFRFSTKASGLQEASR
jgi:hypothetical protein